MKVIPTQLAGVVIIEPKVFTDPRGFFLEFYHADRYGLAGIPTFVQDNHSSSMRGTIRGLHYQLRRPQGKLLRAIRGAVFDVAADIRRGSPDFGRWVGVELSADNKRQLFVPAGFAHGFCVTSDVAEVEYKCTDFYAPDDEHGVVWNDPTIGIKWPTEQPILSDKDGKLPALTLDRDDLPPFTQGS